MYKSWVPQIVGGSLFACVGSCFSQKNFFIFDLCSTLLCIFHAKFRGSTGYKSFKVYHRDGIRKILRFRGIPPEFGGLFCIIQGRKKEKSWREKPSQLLTLHIKHCVVETISNYNKTGEKNFYYENFCNRKILKIARKILRIKKSINSTHFDTI